MNCTKVLHVISSHPQPAALSFNLAKCLSVSQRQAQLSSQAKQGQQGQTTFSLPRPGLHSPYTYLFHPQSPVPVTPSSKPRSCFRRGGSTLPKKRVVFADTVGLALAAVHLFIPESTTDSILLMKAAPTRLQDQQLLSSVREQQQQKRCEPSLDFPPPMSDMQGFLERLRDTGVYLQRCNITEQCLTGTVCVCHISMHKFVNVRVTFNSWKSHHDVPCKFLQKSLFGSSDIDIFAFSFCLPKNIDMKEQAEFCIHVIRGPGLTPLVDDNMGQNYKLCLDKNILIHRDANRFYPSFANRMSRFSVSKQGVSELDLTLGGGEGSSGNWSRLYPTFAVR